MRSSGLPEPLFDFAHDVGATETEIGEGTIVERLELVSFARPPMPGDDEIRQLCQIPSRRSGRARPCLGSGR